MVFQFVIFIVGLIALTWAADRFVYGASALARNSGISPMIIGLTVVALGSSAPEIFVSATASLAGNRDTAVGNALGSNITNIALVLGITAMIRPIIVSSLTVRREMPVLLLVNGIAAYFILDQRLTQMEGLILIALLAIFIAGIIFFSLKTAGNDPIVKEMEGEVPSHVNTSVAIAWILFGLVILPLSAHFIVESAVNIATYFGISELVIGLTIIAFGTSLPELAASIAGLMKREDDLIMGNIVGSNIFNLLAVLAMPGLLSPGLLDQDAASRDIFVMLGLTLLLVLFSFGMRGGRRINRYEASTFLILFFGYQWFLFG